MRDSGIGGLAYAYEPPMSAVAVALNPVRAPLCSPPRRPDCGRGLGVGWCRTWCRLIFETERLERGVLSGS